MNEQLPEQTSQARTESFVPVVQIAASVLAGIIVVMTGLGFLNSLTTLQHFGLEDLAYTAPTARWMANGFSMLSFILFFQILVLYTISHRIKPLIAIALVTLLVTVATYIVSRTEEFAPLYQIFTLNAAIAFFSHRAFIAFKIQSRARLGFWISVVIFTICWFGLLPAGKVPIRTLPRAEVLEDSGTTTTLPLILVQDERAYLLESWGQESKVRIVPIDKVRAILKSRPPDSNRSWRFRFRTW